MNLTVLMYRQEGDEKVLKKVVELKLFCTDLDSLFGTITLEELQGFVDFVKAIPRGKESDETKAARMARQKVLNKKSGAIKLRAKVDDDSQRRVQCSFPNFLRFCRSVDQMRVKITDDGTLKTVQLTTRLKSPPRARNKKNK